MFGHSLTLFSVFGIEVKINLGWALIATFIAFTLAQGFFPSVYQGLPQTTYWAMALVAVVGLAVSIVLHELSHSVVARAFGLPVRSITLFLFGGVAELEREPPSPAAEFFMAIAGPAMSMALAGIFSLASETVADRTGLAGVFSYLGLLNLVLAVFNLIPAFPMDGGRALRAVLWAIKRDIGWATRAAGMAGGIFGALLIAGGVLLALSGAFAAGLWWILIGSFVRASARGAVVHQASQSAFSGRPVSRFMTTQLDTAPADVTLRAFVDEHLYRHHHDIFPVVEGGATVGVIGRKEVKAVPADRWASTTVRQAMRPITEADAVDSGADAAEALTRMQRDNVGRLLVLDHGRLAGVITLKDLLEVIALKMDLER